MFTSLDLERVSFLSVHFHWAVSHKGCELLLIQEGCFGYLAFGRARESWIEHGWDPLVYLGDHAVRLQ